VYTTAVCTQACILHCVLSVSPAALSTARQSVLLLLYPTCTLTRAVSADGTSLHFHVVAISITRQLTGEGSLTRATAMKLV
jgi:hypothetical protein